MQRFRGQIYLTDGAITRRDLTGDGRHRSEVDEESWHVISLDRSGRVCACLRFLEESTLHNFDDLLVSRAAAARSSQGRGFRRAVEQEISGAREGGVRFGEVGGWAVAEEYRNGPEPLRIILATYGLLELLGSCIGVATATWRHHSAQILRRIGLTPLLVDGSVLAPYHDPAYDCEMEVLRFDSRLPNPKYLGMVKELAASLIGAPLFCQGSPRTVAETGLRAFEFPMGDALLPALSTMA
ncbi:MAG: hypothetical protein ABI759_11485 [Candidatus Solibacter sp.]